jgi:hypothetical protein
MTTWAFIYEHPGSDPMADRHVLDRGGQRTVLVPVPEPSAAPAVAEELIGEGVQLIELCGGFPLTVAASVRAAVPDHIPVRARGLRGGLGAPGSSLRRTRRRVPSSGEVPSRVSAANDPHPGRSWNDVLSRLHR